MNLSIVHGSHGNDIFPIWSIVFVKDSILLDRPKNEREARAQRPKTQELAGGAI